MTEGESGPPHGAGGRPPGGGRWRLLLLAVVVLGAGAGIILFLADPTPMLDPAELARARERWRARGLVDYDITVRAETDARPAELIRTEVRAGKAVRLLRDEKPVDLRDAYTVEGLFRLIEQEVEMAAAKGAARAGAPRGARLRARFHETLGAPMVLKRLASRRLSFVITVERLETPAGEVLHART